MSYSSFDTKSGSSKRFYMKSQVFFIHGAASYSRYEDFLYALQTMPIRDLPSEPPSTRWTNTLRADLGDQYEVFMPSMPNKQNARYGEWKIWFERHFPYLRDGVVLVGWSQGGYFLVKYLLENELPFAPKALCLIAAPFAPADFGGEDGGDFAFDTDRAGDIAQVVSTIHLFHSEDDPVVPYEHALQYQAALPEATFHRFSGHNHFLVPAFPELLTVIRHIA